MFYSSIPLHFLDLQLLRLTQNILLDTCAQKSHFQEKKCQECDFFFGWDSLKGFSASHPTPPAARLGGTRSWEGAQLGQLIPADHTMWCHPQHVKLREEGRRDEYLK